MDKRSFLMLVGAAWMGMFSRAWAQPPTTMPPVRMRNWMWLRKGNGRGPEDWKRLFATAKASGIDAVLPEVYNSSTALYASSRHPQGDLWLEDLIPIAQAEGLELHAWMWQMPCNQEEIWSRHPEWYAVNRNGEPSWKKPAYVTYYRFLCPSRPEVHEFLRASIAEVAPIDGVAGIHLDYIRYPDVILAKQFQKKYGIVQDREYPAYDYCYCDVCREGFKARSGRDPLDQDDPSSDAAWMQYRYDRITHLVNEVLLPEVRRHGKQTTAAVFPNWESVRQQWTAWKIDAVLPMLYHGFYDADIGWIGDQTGWGVRALGGRMDLYAGLFVDHLDVASLPEAIGSARRGGASGISLFEGRNMSEEMWEVLRMSLVDRR